MNNLYLSRDYLISLQRIGALHRCITEQQKIYILKAKVVLALTQPLADSCVVIVTITAQESVLPIAEH